MSKAQFLQENLKPGEEYAGLMLGKNGAPDYHLILIPGGNSNLNWQDALTWALASGGDLPTRREQRLLLTNLPEEFERTWYWSSEQYAANPDYAWSQYFGNGRQDYYHKSAEGRARAVRRIPINQE